MTDEAHKLTGLLAQIAEAADEEAALLCARELGGRPFYFPARPGAEHTLSQLVGMRRATAICKAIGPGELTLPRGPFTHAGEARRLAVKMLSEGKSQAAVAQATRLHIRTIEKLSARLRPDSRQTSLF